jgi:hypothetical protein
VTDEASPLEPAAPPKQALGTTLRTFVHGPRGRVALLIAAVLVGVGGLTVLRQTAPPQDRPAPEPTRAIPAAPRYVPPPTSPPRGDLPPPDSIDITEDRIVGNLSRTGKGPGEAAVLRGVNQIMDWFCPDSTLRQASVVRLDAWKTVKVVARPRPGTEIVLVLRWTGSSYRWEGPYGDLDRCW